MILLGDFCSKSASFDGISHAPILSAMSRCRVFEVKVVLSPIVERTNEKLNFEWLLKRKNWRVNRKRKGKKAYEVSLFISSAALVASLVVSSTGAPLAARLATIPSLVIGT